MKRKSAESFAQMYGQIDSVVFGGGKAWRSRNLNMTGAAYPEPSDWREALRATLVGKDNATAAVALNPRWVGNKKAKLGRLAGALRRNRKTWF